MRTVFLLIALAGAMLLGGFSASARPLSGFAEWRYAQYEARQEGDLVSEGRHFTQQYSLRYEKSGILHGGRAGQWNLALGGEWTGIDSEVNGVGVKIDTAKILYRGDLLLAPGGLPFRLHVYSRDNHRTALLRDTVLERPEADEFALSRGVLLAPGIVTDLSNGQHVETGATLLIGIRNGSYLGRYRDVLSQLPRLLIDYSERFVRNLESNTPQHYRDRNLAFVSLNKKDNWFHYRFHDLTDFINPAENSQEKVCMLGTVDHTLTRQWVNMTNWIRASADGSYTETDLVNREEPVEKRYDLNLFALATRSNWRASGFTTFRRMAKGDSLEKDLEVPLYLQGELDRNTSWRLRFVATREQNLRFASDALREKDILLASAQVETFRQGRYILTPQLDFEIQRGTSEDGYVVRAGMDFRSNPRFRPRFNLFGAYHVTRTAVTGDSDTSSWAHAAEARVDTDLSARLRTGVGESLVYSTDKIRSEVGTISSGVTREGESNDSSVFESRFTWYAEYALSRLTNRLEVNYDYRRNVETEQSVTVSHSLRYNQRNLSLDMRSKLELGDGDKEGVGSATLGKGSSGGRQSFHHETQLSYSPGRAWEGKVNAEYDRSDGDAGTVHRWAVRQDLRYSLFTINGIIRKLAEVRQSLGYDRFTDLEETVTSATTFTLNGAYFPTKRTQLGMGLRYQFYGDTDVLNYHLTAGLNFAKLTLSLDYAYGASVSDGEEGDRDEHRWEVKVGKVF
jgi:hypothetical protein